MTNEMQLAHAAGLPTTGHELAPGHHNNNQNQPTTGFKRVHKLLRGRYPLVITLGLIFGVAGGLTGFLTQKPQFSSGFQVEINPTIHQLGNPMGDPINGYDRFLESQVAVIRSYELIQRALDEEDWKNADGPRGDEGSLVQFAGGLEAENYPAETSIIRVTYSNPDRDLAFAGAQSVMKAYNQFMQESDPIGVGLNLQEVDKMRTKYSNDMMSYQQRLRELQNEFNTDDLNSYQQQQMANLAQVEGELTNANMQLKIDQGLLTQSQPGAAGDGGSASRPSLLTEDQIALADGGKLDSMKKAREEVQHKLDVLTAAGQLENSPAVQQLRVELSVEDHDIQQYIDSVNSGQYRFTNSLDGRTGLMPLKSEIAALKLRISGLQDRYDQQKKTCERYGQYAEMISDLKANLDHAKSSYDQMNAEYDRMVSVRELNPLQMRVISNPILPAEPSSDRRRLMAGVGFLGGAFLPTLVVMLVSVLDGRFRYSDEANADMGGIPLLGILPNLPDLLTDPTQAATAAHCVHQIRTILQITGHSTERRVFAITSGSPGDGKTSLTLALGLSFAASGSRTLLVDGDLIGGGLTARLNVNAEHGVLEAMAARDIGPFIRTTDVADLSFLPVGRAMGGYTGTISPAAVRRLVDEARKQFDVILIDTGPILGSIEASPVAVASDGVVLCVSRGQQRQLVDRALAHMHAIGAKLAGVVFNRAQAHDFERSTNRLGLSSVPAGTDGRRSEAIGPVARAVASSVRSASGGNDR
jgi:capsular exopolysaccharide synthesis family protein